MKRKNYYAYAIDQELFDATPKAVWAAIALAPAFNGGATIAHELTPEQYVISEWQIQHEQGMIPQAVPARFRHLIARSPVEEGV